MADDIPFANGRGPAPRRKMYAAPFGSLQNDAPPIQYGDGQTGPTQGGINALAAKGINPIASPFGMKQSVSMPARLYTLCGGHSLFMSCAEKTRSQ
jgi:hypothetical protein